MAQRRTGSRRTAPLNSQVFAGLVPRDQVENLLARARQGSELPAHKHSPLSCPTPQVWNPLVHVRCGFNPPGAATKSASTRRSAAPHPSKKSSRARTYVVALPTPGAGTKSASPRWPAAPPPIKASPRARTSRPYPPGAGTKSASTRRPAAPSLSKEAPRARTWWLYTPGAATKSASTRRSVAPALSKDSPRARTSWLCRPRGRH